MVALNPVERDQKHRDQKFPKEEITRTYDRENDDSREHGREAIRQTDHDSIAVTVIVHRVV